MSDERKPPPEGDRDQRALRGAHRAVDAFLDADAEPDAEPGAGPEPEEDPKAKFQRRLNVILRGAVGKLETLSDEVLERPAGSEDDEKDP